MRAGHVAATAWQHNYACLAVPVVQLETPAAAFCFCRCNVAFLQLLPRQRSFALVRCRSQQVFKGGSHTPWLAPWMAVHSRGDCLLKGSSASRVEICCSIALTQGLGDIEEVNGKTCLNCPWHNYKASSAAPHAALVLQLQRGGIAVVCLQQAPALATGIAHVQHHWRCGCGSSTRQWICCLVPVQCKPHWHALQGMCIACIAC
jgi:hypothetical protein